MNRFRGRRDDANAVVHATSDERPELRRLIEAQAALDHARRNATWKRECKNLQSASHAVQVAALAAHDAGIGWAEIGDVLGIERAMPQPAVAAEPTPEPIPTPPSSVAPLPVADRDPVRHLAHHVVATALHHLPEVRQAVAG